ncbi:ADP-ribosyltransferase [Tenggerimyces flavus]|uniref:ADP-ribosyltransferase n=1 Tax=Tenggerimyces flavus TaxID=1708749 RepID=A0ABV7YB89_9ACTN|nr:ADP-ribosyltransferase [Tenggerimyces flavus]MBM7786579.1 hypothetical protein [Tenggerimyces flavus]
MSELRETHPAGADLRRLEALADARALDPSRPAYDPVAEYRRTRGPRQLEDSEADDYGLAIWGGATDSLAVEQRAALREYSGESIGGATCYREINSYLRGRGPATAQVESHIRHIDTALELVPVPEDLVVVRGVDPRVFSSPVDRLSGRTIADNAFLSTSIGTTPAFDHDAWIYLTVPKGTPAIYMEAITECPGERELLLGRGLSYLVDRVDRDAVRGKWQVHGRVLPPDEMRSGS